jgi:hypothetical protein
LRQEKKQWLATMPEVYSVSLPFSRLIDQLPAVKATNNPSVIATYFSQLVAEVAKLYAYQVQIIQLSDTIPEANKSGEIAKCLAEGRDYLAQLGAVLEYREDNGD